MYLINILGLYFYTHIDNYNENVLLNDRRTISKEEFWNSVYKVDNESPEEYVKRLVNLVSNYMLLIKHKECKPTFFENWILHFYSQSLGFYEWSDTRNAMYLGGGYCSQHALLLNNLLQEQGIESRILASEGHILNEVKVGGKWIVVDPTFNVIFNASVKELEGHPEIVYQKYKNSRNDKYDKTVANYMKKLFEKPGSHRTIQDSQVYRPTHYDIEKPSFYLIWVIPLFLIGFGLAILKGLTYHALPK